MVREFTLILLACLPSAAASAADRLNVLDFAPRGLGVDRTGAADDSQALTNVINAANAITMKGQPACVYLPAGTYRIVTRPPSFIKAGCIKGDGPTQTIIEIDSSFTGDLFSWSESWAKTTPGPTVVGLRIQGDRSATALQNAFVFYDRNDEVFLDNVEVWNLHGRALYSGITKHASRAYMRESHMRSLRFFEDGAPGVPVVEFSSQGIGKTDATNQIRIEQVDIFGPYGPGFVIRNDGDGTVRTITAESLRIEGWQRAGETEGDLFTIGDPVMTGNVSNIRLTDVELIDPAPGYAALRLTAAPGSAAPYDITVTGMIGGGVPRGEGLRIDAGRTSVFRFSGIHTFGTNVVIGRGVSQIVLDGGGQEMHWTYSVDPTSRHGVFFPVLRDAFP